MPCKVLLINTPIRLDARPSCIPYGLAAAASVLRDHGHEVEIYDVNALRPTKPEILDTLKGMHWDVAGISGLITTFEFQIWLIHFLKTINPHAPVISGGGLATSSSDLLFKRSPVDITAIGEGENTLMELCRAIENGQNFGHISGIVFREGERIVHTAPRENIADLDSIPFPAWDLLPMEVYLKSSIWGNTAGNSSGFRSDVPVTRSMNIVASRGCPFSCNYCYHLFGRSDFRFRTPQNVVDEIETLVDRYGVDFVGFVDDNMMASEKRVLEFCDLMEKMQFPLTWGCHGRATSARRDVLNRMGEVGCVWIGYGIESGSQEILDAMNKRCTVEQGKRAILDTRAAGIFPNTTFVFGYPGERLETIQATVDLKRELDIECGSFFATPYPGTPLYEKVGPGIEEEEMFIRSLGDATSFSINLTEFDNETLFRLKRAMDENRDVV